MINTNCIDNTQVPDEGDKCTRSSISFIPQLTGFSEGHFSGLTSSEVKDLIIRFGPVLYTNNEADHGLIVGWEKVAQTNSNAV